MISFILIGAAGYIAPKHLEAIKYVGGECIAAYDPHDSVGILDRYFPNCRYFREFERLDRFCMKMEQKGLGVDYVSICSPNYLHDAHCRFALRVGASAICEKPLVLKSSNLDSLSIIEKKYSNSINVILQLRLHPSVQKVKEKLSIGENHKLKVQYYTPRGQWYKYSWKGDPNKSGGIHTNIGIHLFDMAIYLLGSVQSFDIYQMDAENVQGVLHLERGTLDFDLSIDMAKEPTKKVLANNEEIDFLQGFTDLHKASYAEIINGRGFGLEIARPSIELCERMRKLT